MKKLSKRNITLKLILVLFSLNIWAANQTQTNSTDLPAQEYNPVGFWSIECESPFAANLKIFFYASIKKDASKIIADIERKGGLLKSENTLVIINGSKITFTRRINQSEYIFKGLFIHENRFKGTFLYYENRVSKGKFKFEATKIKSKAPITNVEGTWFISGSTNNKLILSVDGNKVKGNFILTERQKYFVTGTVINNEIALVRYGYDWYEIYIAISSDGGKTFKGSSYYNDNSVSHFTLSRKDPNARPAEPVFTPPVVNGWKPKKKSKWGGWLVLERGRTILWWIDAKGFIHPILSKSFLRKYKETVLNINFAPRNTNYVNNLTIGFIINKRNAPSAVKGKAWRDTRFTFEPNIGKLFREKGNKRIWFLYQGKIHWIENEKALKKFWPNYKEKINIVEYGFINNYIIGPNIFLK